MALFARVACLIRNLTRRSRVERDLDEELRATVDMLAAEKVRASYTLDDARREALAELGGIESIKEQVRDVRAGAVLDTIGQDVRYAVRLLRRYPLFALTAALSLAVGIGANTAVFTIGSSLLRFSSVAVSDPDRLVDFGRSFDGLPIGFNPGSYPDNTVSRRTREIAIRSALGAHRGTVVRLVVRHALSLTAVGCAIGLVLGVIAGQVLSMLLVGVSPFDPPTLVGAVLCLLIALAGCVVPTMRAVRIAASDALRSE